jgi:glycosyltransferase involved in cell wall biosynthesis
MEKLKIVNVIQSVASEASGVSYSVPQLVNGLNNKGQHEVKLCTLDAGKQIYKKFDFEFKTFSLDGPRGVPTNLKGSQGLLSYLKDCENTIIHTHGLWRIINTYPKKLSLNDNGNKFVISTRGMLSPYSFQKNRAAKLLFWKLLQLPALRACNCIHATSEAEYSEIRNAGIDVPVAIIPNGIGISELKRTPIKDRENSIVYLGRIDPKKNIEMLLKAWFLLKNTTGWKLKIVGPIDSSYAQELKSYASKLDCGNIEFLGAKFGLEKYQIYDSSKAFVLPTINENFGLVVAEALAHGTPVITTKGAPWSAIEEYKCGWWIDPKCSELIRSLEMLMGNDNNFLEQMSVSAVNLIKKHYSWESVVGQFFELYNWLDGNTTKPPFVRLK